ncbi:hypothetical protein HZS_1747, partial [Henneguya salminicola]
DSIPIQRQTWGKFVQKTIANCFTKSNAIYIPSKRTAEECESYAAVDNEFSTEEEIYETDIMKVLEKSNVFRSHSSDTGNDDTLSNPISLAIAKQSLENIRKFIEQNS